MKFTVTMKDPDTLNDCIREAVETDVNALDLAEDEQEAVAERRIEKVREVCSKWFKYGEYLSVEIDTDTQTCTVLEKR